MPRIRHAQKRLAALGVELPHEDIKSFSDVDEAIGDMEAVVKPKSRFEQLFEEPEDVVEEPEDEMMDDDAKDKEAELKAKLDLPPMPKPKSKNELIAGEILGTLEKVVTQMTGWNNPLGMKQDERDAVKQVMANSAAQKLGGDEMVELLKPS